MKSEETLVAQMEPQDAHEIRRSVVARASKENKIKRESAPVAGIL